MNEAAKIVEAAADKEANIIFGAAIDPSLDDEVRVIVIATGFDNDKKVKEEPKKSSSVGSFDFDVDDLDIPAFLRRKD